MPLASLRGSVGPLRQVRTIVNSIGRCRLAIVATDAAGKSAALSALRRQAIDPSYRDSSPRLMAELIEAAVRSGERDLARLALDRVQETTSAAGTNWALGIQARSRALLSERRGRGRPLSPGDRTAFTHEHPRAARPCPPPLR